MASPHTTTSRPRFSTRRSNFRAVPVGFFWPISHFCTVERLVFSRRANTAWLTRDASRICLICSGLQGQVLHQRIALANDPPLRQLHPARHRRNSNALPITLTLLSAMAAPANTGLSMPIAASGMPITL